jgi:ribosomal protein S18 acetylase RimI-like enzyme
MCLKGLIVTGVTHRGGVTIREMEKDDLAAVFHLGEELFTSEEFPILYRTWDAYEVTDFFNMDPEYCLVAEADGEIVGFSLGTTIEKEGSAWKYGYVAWLGVREGYRRRRMAQRLYRELERRMARQGVRMMIVDTEADNPEALAFLQKMGFTGRRSHLWLAKTLRRRREGKA